MTEGHGVVEQEVLSPSPSIREIDVLWITAGLGCDGDTIAMTAATQPTLEELLLGGIPGIPKVRLHNPFLAYENGEEFMEIFYRGAEGKLEPYILVVEGSIPNEGNKTEGYWAAFGSNRETGQPTADSTDSADSRRHIRHFSLLLSKKQLRGDGNEAV